MKKQILILALVFAVLTCAVVVFTRNKNDLKSVVASQPLFSFSKDDIAAFQVNNFLQGYAFKKVGETWMITHVQNEMTRSLAASGKLEQQAPSTEDTQARPADLVKVTALLTHLTTLRIAEPVASEPDAAAHFQINSYSPHVILFDKDGRELGRLYVGKAGADFMTSSVKRNAENDIYLVDENMTGLLLISL